MDRRLWMHNDLHPLRRHLKQPASLNHLEPLIHQGCRVDGDPFSHLPRRMIQRLLDRNGSKFHLWRFQKRTARSRQPDPLHLFYPPAPQTLVDGIMLAINRQQRLSLSPRLRPHPPPPPQALGGVFFARTQTPAVAAPASRPPRYSPPPPPPGTPCSPG